MSPAQMLESCLSDHGPPIAAETGTAGLISRNVTIAGHRTSIRLEPDMWTALKEISVRENTDLHEICTAVAQNKQASSSFTAAIRVFIMAYFRAAATDEGHRNAGHGNGRVRPGAHTSGAHRALYPKAVAASPIDCLPSTLSVRIGNSNR